MICKIVSDVSVSIEALSGDEVGVAELLEYLAQGLRLGVTRGALRTDSRAKTIYMEMIKPRPED